MTNWPEQRLSAPDPATYTDRQRAIHEAIASGPRGGVRGPLAVWLHRPELAARAQDLGRYCRYESALEPRLSELAILTMARHWGAEYEWFAHKPPALQAGLSPDLVEALRTGAEPPYGDDEERVTHLVAVSVLTSRDVPDALYAEAVQVLGTQRLVDLVGVIGYYTLISATLNVFRISPPADAPRALS
ncbi:Carboxymuconolactone decarboxylase family protein [Marinibacterium anthonyi]|nr:Carboxymuconolactone decarboxylase family protein [Marinibacterium anthonyi]